MTQLSACPQEEVQELKEQVMMYESASQLGVHPGGTPQATTAPAIKPTLELDDSYAQLGIKKGAPQSSLAKSAFSTPESYRYQITVIKFCH